MQLAAGYHESSWFNRLGARSRAFATPFGKCGVLICNDRWNPDLARIPVLRETARRRRRAPGAPSVPAAR